MQEDGKDHSQDSESEAFGDIDPELGSEAEEDTIVDSVSKEERRARAIIRSQQPLSEVDFETIRQLRLEAKLLPAVGRKRKREDPVADESTGPAHILEPDVVMPEMKRGHQTKEERLESVMMGREDRGKFNVRKGHEGGSTNRQKEHKKNPMMIKQKLDYKMRGKMSMRDKQIAKTGKKKGFRGHMGGKKKK